MRVSPVTELRIAPSVFISHVVATDPCNSSVNNHGLTMVAENELKSVSQTFTAVKRPEFNACIRKSPAVSGGHPQAADLVIQKQYPDAPLRSGDQPIL